MRTFVVASFVLLVGCTRPNPDFCDSSHPCEAGQACTGEGMCVAAECDTSAECTDPNAPVCIGNLCVAACTQDADCNGAVGAPHCAPDGQCVGCVDASQCSGDTNICDADTRSCRGCERDSECPGGVCLEADGVCAADANVVFVTTSGTDAGHCDRGSPCATFSFGLSKITASRSVLHIDGGSLAVPSTTTSFSNSTYVDGTDTTLMAGPSSTPLFDASNVTVTFGRISVDHGITPAITVSGTASLHLFAASVGIVDSQGATITAVDVDVLTGGGLHCTGGAVEISDSRIDGGDIHAINCQVRVTANRFDHCVECIYARGGFAKIENNLVVAESGLDDGANITQMTSGSSFRFNTLVNTTSTPSDGAALYCDGSLDVTSNIFAYRSAHPHAQGVVCPTRYSLYDEVAPASLGMREGNKAGTIDTFFTDLLAKDFHLAPSSPARDSAEPGLDVPQDLDGASRGAMPDMGAFEAR